GPCRILTGFPFTPVIGAPQRHPAQNLAGYSIPTQFNQTATVLSRSSEKIKPSWYVNVSTVFVNVSANYVNVSMKYSNVSSVYGRFIKLLPYKKTGPFSRSCSGPVMMHLHPLRCGDADQAKCVRDCRAGCRDE